MNYSVDNTRVGEHLSKLINTKFPSQRQFAKAVLELGGETADADRLSKMSNRISGIVNGKKSIQITDLPVFTHLLQVSCEEILSGGKSFSYENGRLTNYSVSLSGKKEVWEEYVALPEQPILNFDEYGKSLINYALEFRNYPLMKYLTENGIIEFTDEDNEDDYMFFSGGTRLKYDPARNDILASEVSRKEIRQQMTALAAENGDIDMLVSLRAREIPSLCLANSLACRAPECDDSYDGELISRIAASDERVLDYFTEEFEVKNSIGKQNRFMFPYMSELIAQLINNRSKYASTAIKRATAHNKRAYEQMSKLIGRAMEEFGFTGEAIRREFDYYEDGSIISFRNTGSRDGMITNIISTGCDPDGKEIKKLSEELDMSFERVKNLPNEPKLAEASGCPAEKKGETK